MTKDELAAVVASVKVDLVKRGVNLNGACGAFAITCRVAWILRSQGYKFLRKTAGNRAIPQPGGGCLTGDESSAPGYATDYLIAANEGFVGYDILGDGGGANDPQWNGPENDPTMVARNMANWAEPFDPGDGTVPVPDPTPSPAPVPTPTPVDLGPVLSAITALKGNLAPLESGQFELVQRLDALKDEFVSVRAELEAIRVKQDRAYTGRVPVLGSVTLTPKP